MPFEYPTGMIARFFTWMFLFSLTAPVAAMGHYYPQARDVHSRIQAYRGPASVKKEAPFVESRPADIGSYLRAGRTPKYIRVNVNGYNVRTSPDFASAKTHNVDFKSSAGSLFAVSETRRLTSGVAVGIYVDGKKRWLFVPYFRKSDFQFCESEACFAAMAESLDLLSKPSLLTSAPGGCDLNSSSELVSTFFSEDAPAPSRPKPAVAKLDSRIPAESRPSRLQVAPYWEIARGSRGALWTRQLQDSLRKYGSTLLNSRKFRDQNVFCPNYSNLSASQREEFWVHMFSAIADPESGYTPGPGYEKLPVYDEVTHHNPGRGYINEYGSQHYSMGILALTYKYNNNVYQPYCSGISARRDFGKSIHDPSLTIYNTKNQFDCAVGIMNYRLSKLGDIGYYGEPAWSTVRATNVLTRQKTLPKVRRFTPCFSRTRGL